MSITTHLIVMFTTILYFIRHCCCCCCCFWDGDTLCCFVLHNMCRKWSETDDQQRKKNSQPGNGSLCIQTWYETYSILIPWVKNHWRLVFITCWLPFQFFFFLHNFSLFLFFFFSLLVLSIEMTTTTKEKMMQKTTTKWTTNQTKTKTKNVYYTYEIKCRITCNGINLAQLETFPIFLSPILIGYTNKNLYRCFYYCIDVYLFVIVIAMPCH